MIIIFSIENDISTCNVVKWLNFFNKEVVVINADDNCYKFVRLNENEILFKNTITKKTINLLDADSCWWRRSGLSMRNFSQSKRRETLISDNLDLSELLHGKKNKLTHEISDLIDYIFNKIYNHCKINIGRPDKYGLNRLATIDLAKQHGFKVFDYAVVSNTSQIDTINKNDERVVTKAISDGIYDQIENLAFYSYTELYKKEEFNSGIEIFPSLITSLIEKKIEIRAFYLAGTFYSIAIFSQNSDQTKVDFRKYNNTKPNRTEPYKLPKKIETRLKLLFDELGLNCGSADLILDNNNEYVFLEINPVGQYQMTSDPGNYNLDNVIAKYLIDGRIE